MAYDWDGHRTRRLRLAKLITAVSVGLSLPIMIVAWSAYIQ